MNRNIRQLILAGLLLAAFWAGSVDAAWPYTYSDGFDSSAETARGDAAIHSQFWVDRATPPPGPYIYYGDGSLTLMGYQNQFAEFGYCFPMGSADSRKAVVGEVTVEVSFPDNAIVSQSPENGYLAVSVSGDGVAWSEPQRLWEGTSKIAIGSPVGTAYIRFSGTRVALESISAKVALVSATIFVPGNYTTIQQAINAAGDGDIIEVADGTYYASNLDFLGKAITLRSASGPLKTTIDAGGSGRGFNFHSGEGADSVVSGFTIKNAQISGSFSIGGGIACTNSSPTIINCIVENCSAAYGGGIGLFQSDATITLCDIEGNVATSGGGGLYVSNSVAFIGGSYLSNNSAPSQSGGGAFCIGPLAEIVFQNCVIASNVAAKGAGLYTEPETGRVTVANCTIAGNTSGHGIYSVDTSITVTNSIIWDNTNSLFIRNSNPPLSLPVTYCDVQGGYEGEGNFSEDPKFVGTGDYHLQSKHGRYRLGLWPTDTYDSPCIDAGDPATSAACEPDTNGARVNMGAYGGTGEASKSIEHFVYHVATDGADWSSRSGLSPDLAFRTIDYALGRAGSGDTILVWPGVYEEELVFESKAVTLRSAADAAVLIAKDKIAVSFYGAEGAGSVLSNFVIRGSSEGAIFCEGASPTLRNLTIVNNGYGIFAWNGADPYIANCILWNNGSVDLSGADAYYCDIKNADDNVGGFGNISQNPLFVDAYLQDYHLRSEYGRYEPVSGQWILDNETSPCIDAGDLNDDFEAELEPNGDVINMGAYGGTPYASKSRF